MGNEISTLTNGATTVGAAVLAGVTLGQVQPLNDAVKKSASITAERAQNTIVRHVGEATVMATATVTVGLASVVTLGQVQAVNDAAANCASYTAQASNRAGTELIAVADGVTDAMPVVGHVKGGICYAVGANERGERALKSASRSIGVATGGITGLIVGGPPGAIAGSIAGGATMDAIITGADSAINGDYRPNGLIANVTQITTAATTAERVEAIASALSRVTFDVLGGVGAGGLFDDISGSDVAPTVPGGGTPLDIDPPSVEPDAEPDDLLPFGANLPRMTLKQFATLATTLYDLGVEHAISVAADLVFSALVAMYASEQPHSEEASNGSRSQAHESAPTVGETKKCALDVEMKRVNAVEALKHAFVKMSAGFKTEFEQRKLSAKKDLENSTIVQLNAHDAKQRMLDALAKAVAAGVKRGDPPRKIVVDVMGQAGSILGQKTAETIRDVLASNHTKKELERIHAQVMELAARTRTRAPAREDQQADRETSVAIVVQQQAVSSELLFILIIIYAAISAFMMTPHM